MKKIVKNFLLLTLVIFTALIPGGVFALDDWGNVYDSYRDAEYGKIISGQDYQNAINAIKEYKKPDKKLEKKLKEKGLDLKEDENESKVKFEVPARQEPLLRLPMNVSYEGKLIQRGYYLARAVSSDNRYFIRLTQGEGRVVADIEANVFKTDNLQKVSKGEKKVFSEMLKNDMLKITYSNRELILEAYVIPYFN